MYWLEGLGFAMIPWDWCYAEIYESIDACIARAKSYDGRGIQKGRMMDLDNLEVNELMARTGLVDWSC